MAPLKVLTSAMPARLCAAAPSDFLYQHRHRLSTGLTAHRSSFLRPRSQQISSCRSQATEEIFESLAGLICPQEIPVALGVTDLGRGLVATQDVPAGACLLSVDCFSTLLVVDEPLKTGDVFGASVLTEWQSLWGMELPPLLDSYLRSSECPWQQWRCTAPLWCAEHSTQHCQCCYRASSSLQQWMGQI